MALGKRMMAFIDGENLTMRYQAMIAAGKKPSKLVTHEPDVLVWHPTTVKTEYYIDILRITYYTYATGTDEYAKQLCDQIKTFRYEYRPTREASKTGHVYPRIFRKLRKEAKRKGVDINITVDALTHTFGNSVDIVYLVTGDGDYLPLIEAIIRSGKQVHLAALSSGLNERLPNSVDKFIDLDPFFFEK